MNLRNAENYTIGLDIGTGSVGWAIIDEEGDLFRFKGKNTWGSRIFPSAETAATTRLKRGQRRRYARRRQRINLLRKFFSSEMQTVDSDFFIRMNQARLLKEDRDPNHSDYQHPLFNSKDFNEQDYYRVFPTIYHLRKHLITSTKKEDIRFIYLALHNITKYRGNFLYQDEPDLSAKTANPSKVVNAFEEILADYCIAKDISITVDGGSLVSTLSSQGLKKGEKRDAIKDAFTVSKEYEQFKNFATAVSKAIVGDIAEYADIFGLEKSVETKFSLSKEEKVSEFESVCADEDMPLFVAIQSLSSAFILSGILKGAKGGTLSDSMVDIYEKHGRDLNLLQMLFKKYAPEGYDEFFRGEKDSAGRYFAHAAKGYTAYIIGEKKCSQDDLYKEIKKIFDTIPAALGTPEYKSMLADMEEGIFLQKLKTRNNGAIPYQLHLEEMTMIIENQGKHYSFLVAEKSKIESLVSFRIPYYVGPLNSKHSPENGGRKFAWSKRLEGKENETVYPWNFDEIIDKDASAEEFILRMTGKCTYLLDQDVLPRHSLLYEEFCLLNELNSTQWNKDGENFYRFDTSDRLELIEEVFKKRKTVRHVTVSDWLKKRGFPNTTIRGTQEEDRFVSQLSTYWDFRKILDVDVIDEKDIPMIEELVFWNTLFEDKSILKRKINQKYSNRLSTDQVKQVCAKRYTGWGRLSSHLLNGLKADVDGGAKTSIIEIMRDFEDGNGRPLNLMEILRNKEFSFEKAIAEHNTNRGVGGLLAVEDIPGSPALKRSVHESLRIVDELISVSKGLPKKICIEFTRDDDYQKKGRRTQSRYKKLEEAYQAFKRENPSVYEELQANKDNLGDDRLMLYFSQLGKSLYSGKVLDINNLSSYQVDHILPQSYIKDDSFDNKALVLVDENERKLDSMLLDERIIRSQRNRWGVLHQAGLISDKKYNNLIRTQVKDRNLEGFINRQLVETNQIVKHVANLLRARYPEVIIVPIKASLSSALRDKCGFVKCREINNYHHAHDAYLACQMDRFTNYRYPKLADGFDLTVFKRFIKKVAIDFSQSRRITGSAGFIVESFLRSGFDKETGEIFKDLWDADKEADRIRRCLAYSDCFISRKPEITSGAFWDETIYSPRDPKKGKNLEIPLKNNNRTDSFERYLDPQKYGGPSGKDYAYFFVFLAKDKKGQDVVFYEGLPLYVASCVEKSKEELLEYAKKIAEEASCFDVRILKERVLKYQKIYLDENCFYMTGQSDARNATQLVLGPSAQYCVCEIMKYRKGEIAHFDEEELNKLYQTIFEKLDTLCPKLAAMLKLNTLHDKFLTAEIGIKCKSITEMLNIISGTKSKIDLSDIGGPKFAGYIRLTYKNEISEIIFADVSVTGLFERKYKLEL